MRAGRSVRKQKSVSDQALTRPSIVARPGIIPLLRPDLRRRGRLAPLLRCCLLLAPLRTRRRHLLAPLLRLWTRRRHLLILERRLVQRRLSLHLKARLSPGIVGRRLGALSFNVLLPGAPITANIGPKLNNNQNHRN